MARGGRLSAVVTAGDCPETARPLYERRAKLICELVMQVSGFDWQQLISSNRSRDLAETRQICMYLLLQHTHLNLPQVGVLFGGRDHTTVLHARDKVQAQPGRFSAVLHHVETELGVQ